MQHAQKDHIGFAADILPTVVRDMDEELQGT